MPANDDLDLLIDAAQAAGDVARKFTGPEAQRWDKPAGAGPVTAAELASRTGLHERWLLEWLRLQTAAKVLDYVDETHFELAYNIFLVISFFSFNPYFHLNMSSYSMIVNRCNMFISLITLVFRLPHINMETSD